MASTTPSSTPTSIPNSAGNEEVIVMEDGRVVPSAKCSVRPIGAW